MADKSNIVGMNGSAVAPSADQVGTSRALEAAIMAAIEKHGTGMLYPTILGTLEFCKDRVKDRAYASATKE